ncbi:heptaprenyl diphosphate synthase component 1 [Paenibacillus sp. GD4]|jgi:heptaprenyl diphosphate synthase|uniref:heptaprenyl diphosphate synthase component 1 n=1 Tax=Paenibacillus TaxID=44249 RepID=UPI0025427E48|nr:MULTISPECIES: heptaprenyl diphosphate synthase component 1 [Paenibacillus]MDQ1909421.1 heptaprenyl diphosphate synthase component 1 [Paenibacillus sp. GD4]
MNSYRIPEIARKYFEHDMILKHTELPVFPEFRTRLLYAFLNRHSALSGHSELYTLVTSLVQMGLDTHDMVSITNDSKEMKAARSRQLKVLAGDYFSSRFYYLLSHAGHIDLIGKLSQAICEANRLKMNMYMTMKQLKLTAEEYIRQTVEVRSQLFLSFSVLLDEGLRGLWPEILRLFTRCEVLIQEITRSESAEEFRDSWGYWLILQTGAKDDRKLLQTDEPDHSRLRYVWHKYKVSSQLYDMLDACLSELQDKLKGMESEKLGAELLNIGEPLRKYLNAPRVIEEV